MILKTADLLKRARKILKQNKAEVSDDDLIKSAFELPVDKKDPQRKALRQTTRVTNNKTKHIKQVKQIAPAWCSPKITLNNLLQNHAADIPLQEVVKVVCLFADQLRGF